MVSQFALLTLTAGLIQHEAYWPVDIPRVIHICFKTVEAVPAVVQSKWLSMNPSFKLIVHGDVECYSFLLDHFGAEIAGYYKKMPGQIKGCIFRIFYLYMHGGVYADVDVEPVVSLDHMVQPGRRRRVCHRRQSNTWLDEPYPHHRQAPRARPTGHDACLHRALSDDEVPVP